MAVTVLAIAVIQLEMVDSRGIFSRFVKKESAENVRATLYPEGQEEQCVILSCHHDSAYLYRSRDHLKDIYIPLCTLLYLFALSLFMILYEALSRKLFAFNLPSVIPAVFITLALVLSVLSLKLYNLFSRNASPGVGDNLSGVGICLSLSEYFSKRRLKRTKLEFISFDGEEAGCQGSRHHYGNNNYADGTININIDGIYDEDSLYVLSLDGNGLVHLDEQLSMELSQLAKSMGYKMKAGKLSFLGGATDASSAAKAGIRAVTITGMVPDAENSSHTAEDTIEKIDRKALEDVISLVIKYIEGLDGRKPEESEDEEGSFLDPGRKYRISIRD